MLLFQGGDRNAPVPHDPQVVHGPGGLSTMRAGYRLYPNPMTPAGVPTHTAQACQAACAANASCAGAVYNGNSCFSLASIVSFYASPGFSSWSKGPVRQTSGPGPSGAWVPPGGLLPGVNATNCKRTTISQLSIDYEPKPPSLFCYAPHPGAPHPSPSCVEGPVGITLHLFNCSDMLAEDVTIHAAPYMACTSFNGEVRF